MTKSDGNHAHPQLTGEYKINGTRLELCGVVATGGLTKREYFAAAALTGILAQPDQRTYSGDPSGIDAWRDRLAADDVAIAFRYAAAMLSHDQAEGGKP